MVTDMVTDTEYYKAKGRKMDSIRSRAEKILEAGTFAKVPLTKLEIECMKLLIKSRIAREIFVDEPFGFIGSSLYTNRKLLSSAPVSRKKKKK